MNPSRHAQTLLALLIAISTMTTAHAEPSAFFQTPDRGFTSSTWVEKETDYINGILTGNGTVGALALGRPHDERIFLSHAALYLPDNDNKTYIDFTEHMPRIKALCLAGDYKAAGDIITQIREELDYTIWRDRFIGALSVHIQHPEAPVQRYQRSVDFMTAEANVEIEDDLNTIKRSVFASRQDGTIVIRITADDTVNTDLAFHALAIHSDHERRIQQGGVASSQQGVKDGYLYFRTLFAKQNRFNPNVGFEAIGRVITRDGKRVDTPTHIQITGADEVLLLIKIRPLTKTDRIDTAFDRLKTEIDAVSPDYQKLLAAHAEVHGDLMSRVDFSLNATGSDRARTNEQLFKAYNKDTGSLALTERVFDAARYHIICSTGYHPPNLQGIWSASWFAAWYGSFTTNGNLPCAVAFNLMGNTPELMEPYFRYHDERWDGFRTNAKVLYGARGFHVPAQLTVSPLHTDFFAGFPHVYWHAGAPWTCLYYYDYYRYTGDRDFLEQRAYPLMKEAAAFFEDFLTERDDNGKLVFVPSYSPENYPGGGPPTSINATMDISACKQLLRNTIAASKILDRDEALRPVWSKILEDMPDYAVDDDGYFREWLWPGLDNNINHRHASLFYALYDDHPSDILDNPTLVEGVRKYLQDHLVVKDQQGDMAFGTVQDGLAAVRIGDADLTHRAINLLLDGFWGTGLGSMHDRGRILNMDISGGFPYLCASSLVYADQGVIYLHAAKPAAWKSGSLKGVRLRGNILVTELTWNPAGGKLVLESATTQTVRVVFDGQTDELTLQGGKPTVYEFQSE